MDENRRYKLDRQADGRYRVESWDRECNEWFPLSASDKRMTSILNLEALRASANADPLVICPECNTPIYWPLDYKNFVGADGLYYCSAACATAHIASARSLLQKSSGLRLKFGAQSWWKRLSISPGKTIRRFSHQWMGAFYGSRLNPDSYLFGLLTGLLLAALIACLGGAA